MPSAVLAPMAEFSTRTPLEITSRLVMAWIVASKVALSSGTSLHGHQLRALQGSLRLAATISPS